MRKRTKEEIEELKQQVFVNKKGYKARIIEYRNSNDIDIMFENGVIAEHKTLSSLQKGSFDFKLLKLREKEIQNSELNIDRVNGLRYSGGKIGIYKNGKNWTAQITINGKTIYLGTGNKEEIKAIRKQYEEKYYIQQNDLNGEIWKNIDESKGCYSISNYGRVKNNNTNYILVGGFDRNGYKQVTLCYGNKQYNRRICRLVAKAFIPNPDNLPQVNHKNEIKSDDNVENLEWCSAKYNNNYGNRIKNAKNTKNVICIETNELFNSVRQLAQKINTSHTTITRYIRNNQPFNNLHYKYI